MSDDIATHPRFGPKPMEFSADQRNQAEVLSGLGLQHKQIAILVGCSEPTLRKHLGAELASGDAKATARIAQTLFNKAIQGDTASMIFWMKTRANWRETNVLEHTGPDGGPIQVSAIDRPPNETREQWVARRQLQLEHSSAIMGPPAGTAD